MAISADDAGSPGTLPSEMANPKVRLRRAGLQDVEYLLALQIEPDVAPFLAAGRAASREELVEEVERSLVEPAAFGRLMIETPFEREWRLVGAIGFERTNKRSRIARIGGLAVHPDFRGRGLGRRRCASWRGSSSKVSTITGSRPGSTGSTSAVRRRSKAPASCARASSAALTGRTANGWTRSSSVCSSRSSKPGA